MGMVPPGLLASLASLAVQFRDPPAKLPVKFAGLEKIRERTHQPAAVTDLSSRLVTNSNAKPRERSHGYDEYSDCAGCLAADFACRDREASDIGY